jgi:hypothetical protein
MKPTLDQEASCPTDSIEDVSSTLEFPTKKELPAPTEEEVIARDDPL